MHSFRRLRALASAVHNALRKIDIIEETFTTYILETGDEAQIELLLGASCLSAFDEDRHIASSSKSNLQFIESKVNESILRSIETFLDRVLFAPTDMNLQIYGPPRTAEAEGASEQSGDEFEDMPSRFARWRSSGIRTIIWLMSELKRHIHIHLGSTDAYKASDPLFTLSSEWLQETLQRPSLWAALRSIKDSETTVEDSDVDGISFPRVRIAIWDLLDAILGRRAGQSPFSVSSVTYIVDHIY